MQFYADGRKGKRLRGRDQSALQALLASPHFLFRLEETPSGVRPGQNYRVSDVDLASRLSFFIWGSSPDAELLKVAGNGTLHTPAVLEKQVRRMLADPRGEAMATRFAAQWLRLQDVEKIHPDALLFPSFDNELAESYKRETELLFDSIVREDRNVLDLLTADYTFINERIAQALRNPEHHRRRVPPRAARRREPARHARPRQHPDADVGRRSHVAGAARQVDHGDAARIAAAAAAAGRAAPLEETKAWRGRQSR